MISHIYICKRKKNELIDAENRFRLPEAGQEWGTGEIGKVVKRYKLSNYKTSHGDVMYNMVTIINNTTM